MTPSKWCLITGVASGLGRACLSKALEDGLGVIGIDIDEKEIEHLRLQFSDCMFFCFDVRDNVAFDSVLEIIRDRNVELKIAILAAGIGYKSPFLDLSIDKFISTIEVNLLSRVVMARALYNQMSQSSGGMIYLISSSSGLAPLKTFAAYSASNAALLSFGRAWNAEIQNSNVRVTTVVPSGMRTNFQVKAGAQSGSSHLIDPVIVAEKIFRAQKPVLILGRSARITYLATKFLPRSWIDKALGRAVSVFT